MEREWQPTTYKRPKKSGIRHPVARLLVLALLLAGFAIRLYQQGGESLWYDETVSAYLAAQPVVDLIQHTARDIHPPAYYLLLHLWRQIAQPSVAFGLEFLFAWPSLFFDMLVLALSFAVARRCFGVQAAFWALALAMVHPTQIWMSQEVRMYALGAFSLLLTLWSVTPLLIDDHRVDELPNVPRTALRLYPFAALLGLYTLYYFAFWLVILNLCVIVLLWRNRRDLILWFAMQLLVVLGWLPWLPIFLRQAINPPVPPWRNPWQNANEILEALSEATSALWTAHISPLALTWPWAVLVVVVALGFFFLATATRRQNRLAWLLLCFGPPLLLFDISLVGPPIYHVRYVSTYAPVFTLIAAAFLATSPRILAGITYIAFAALGLFATNQLWSEPQFASDDHRNAVATLAQQWRPGDAILVNAGWAYTALSVYWPTELPNYNSSRPPDLAQLTRLTPENTQFTSDTPYAATVPVAYTTGSVDGDPDLGWGLPESDFFAISAQDTRLALTQLADTHSRIWHYRLYDTVSDPNEVIRRWLSDNLVQEYSESIPGRDYLLLERYQTVHINEQQPLATQRIQFADTGLNLISHKFPTELPAGETLYITTTWTLTVTPPSYAIALSVRLYDARGDFLVQQDERLHTTRSNRITQTLALPIPADTPPGPYYVALVAYDPETLAPYLPVDANGDTLPVPLPLGELAINLPLTIPRTPAPMAAFDYINLISVQLPTAPLNPGATLDTVWTWRPQASEYRDHYRAVVRFLHEQSDYVLRLDFDLGTPEHPSSVWPAHYPITQRVRSLLPADLPQGTYRVQLALERASDGQQIPARQGWRFWQSPAVRVGTLEVMTGDTQ